MADPDDTDAEPGTDPQPESTPTANDDAAKWKALARKHEKQAKDLADRLQGLEDKDKSDSERLTEKLAQLEKDLAAATSRADRYEVALEKGLDMVRAKRLTGSTRDELEADADELTTWQAGAPAGDKPAPGKPTEALSGGGDPTQEPDPDVRQVVDSIPRGF